MNLRPLAFSLVLIAACAAGTQAEAPVPTGSAGAQASAAPALQQKPRLKMSNIEWGVTQLCADGDCVVAKESDKADIRESLNEARWMCCCAGTTSDSAGDCQCASKESCDGCSC